MELQPLKPGYLVMGLLFVAAALIWALDAASAVDLPDGDVFWPVALIVAGVLGVAVSVRRVIR